MPSETIAPPAATAFVAPAPAAAFHAVIQHDDSDGDEHKPVRKRRSHEDAHASQAAELQLVETQAPVTSMPIEDDLPRRTRPRRRRGGQVANEPLMLVETQNDAPRGDTPPAQ